MTSYPNPRELYKKLQAAFLLHIVEKQVHLFFAETASPERLRVAMEMLWKTPSKVGNFTEIFLHRVLQVLTTRCTKIRETLDALLGARGGGQKALQYKFNSSAQVFSTDVFFTVDVDLGSNLLMPASTDARARAKKNLEGFQLFGRDRCLAQMCKRIRFEVPNIDSTPSPLSGSPVFTWENQVHALRASSSVCRSCSGSKTP